MYGLCYSKKIMSFRRNGSAEKVLIEVIEGVVKEI